MRTAHRHAPARAVRSAAGALFLLGCSAARAAEPAAGSAVPATNLLAAVSAGYAAVTNLSCTVRRQIPGEDGELVSRVVFARGGRLNVETLAPEPRRVVVDGESAWSKGPDDGKPVRVAFADQSPAQKANVLCVPASPEEQLSALDGATGADLPSPAPPHARQTAFRFKGAPPGAPGRAVVSFDAEGRVRAVDLFADADLRWRVASYAWDAPVEVLPGVWLFGRATAETAVDGRPVALSTRFDGIRANAALDPDLFDAEKAFE